MKGDRYFRTGERLVGPHPEGLFIHTPMPLAGLSKDFFAQAGRLESYTVRILGVVNPLQDGKSVAYDPPKEVVVEHYVD